MNDANDSGRRSRPTAKTPNSPSLPRSARAFLALGERNYARRDFLSRSSVAALVVAAGGVFFALPTEASVPTSPVTGGASSMGISTHVQTQQRPAALGEIRGAGVRVAQTCPHASHGSHGSHGSHASHGSHGSHGSW